MAAIGRVLLMPKGAYNGSTVYNALDWVRHDSKAWVCRIDGTVGIVPSEGANWTLLAADGSVSGSVAWIAVTGKPFDDVDSTDFDVNGSNNLIIKRDTFGTMRIVSGGTTTNLEASGDSVFEIDAGTNVTINADDTANPKKITINSTGGGGSVIDDTTTALDKTWSSSKINTELGNKADDSDLDGWFATSGTVSSGSVSFSGVDDSAGTNGYQLFVNVTSSSTNKNPSSQISTITGSGTASMSITFTTDADNGATAKLRILK